jgi:predicted transcriptional regulator
MAKSMTMIRIDEHVKNELKKLAAKENRSLSNFILNATLQYIKENYGKELNQQKNKLHNNENT